MPSLFQVYSNNIVEEPTPKVCLSSASILNCTTEVDVDNIKQNDAAHSLHIMSNNSNVRQGEPVRCNFLNLLKLCWLWVCGLNNENDDCSELEPATNENGDLIENRKTMLTYIKERSLIKWLLNGNLIFILLVEIILFIVFSIPAKYTFLRE
jgi:hypothetical protein